MLKTITHILVTYTAIFICGLAFVVTGILIPKYRLYYLIAGLNGLHGKALQNIT